MSMILADLISPYTLIIAASVILIASFFFNELSKMTNIPSVLMLIVLGIIIKLVMDATGGSGYDFFPILEILGIVGLIMIVLEAALELELKPEKYMAIAKSFGIALVGLGLSVWVAAIILQNIIPSMSSTQAWIYATPLSILSSAIIIPSVSGLISEKKEFHIYESTFSDILGIMLFYFLTGNIDPEQGSGAGGFVITLILTIILSLVASYLIVIIFQNIKSHVKLFLLIAVLLLLYAIGKQMHLSSLIIILVFGLLIANMNLFFRGPLSHFLQKEKAKDIYHGLHVITIETAFVVRTFFFVIFGITITLSSLASISVAIISALLVVSIYLIRYIILRVSIGTDILPQLYIAPRGLITVLLFYAIPAEVESKDFSSGILLYIIIATGVIMTIAMIQDKRRSMTAIREANEVPVKTIKWKATSVEDLNQ